jgi:peptidoglycan-N-acetylglucosamine deacetylase
MSGRACEPLACASVNALARCASAGARSEDWDEGTAEPRWLSCPGFAMHSRPPLVGRIGHLPPCRRRDAAWHHAGMSASPLPLPGFHRVPRRSVAWAWWLLASQCVVAALWWQLGWRSGVPLLVASHLLFLWGVLWPRSTMYGPVLAHLPVTAKRVWLTIDDGPSADTRALLDLLDAHGAKATFFVVGERAAAQPDLVREIVARGHGIGNHSSRHPSAWFWALGPRRMRDEIVRCQDTLRAITGTAPHWFRAVVGMANPFVSAPLRECGLARVAWDARAFDALEADPARVVARIERRLSPGAIVLLHEGAGHGRNLEAIALLLQRMQVLGYTTVLPEEL